MTIKTFVCFMFFLGIFPSFFQSHSSLCSFKKYKNLLGEKIINHLQSNLYPVALCVFASLFINRCQELFV